MTGEGIFKRQGHRIRQRLPRGAFVSGGQRQLRVPDIQRTRHPIAFREIAAQLEPQDLDGSAREFAKAQASSRRANEVSDFIHLPHGLLRPLHARRSGSAGQERAGTGEQPSVRGPGAVAAGVAARSSATPWRTTAIATAGAFRSGRESGAVSPRTPRLPSQLARRRGYTRLQKIQRGAPRAEGFVDSCDSSALQVDGHPCRDETETALGPVDASKARVERLLGGRKATRQNRGISGVRLRFCPAVARGSRRVRTGSLVTMIRVGPPAPFPLSPARIPTFLFCKTQEASELSLLCARFAASALLSPGLSRPSLISMSRSGRNSTATAGT